MKIKSVVRAIGTENTYIVQGIEEVVSGIRYRYKLIHCIGEFSQEKKTFKEWEIVCEDDD